MTDSLRADLDSMHNVAANVGDVSAQMKQISSTLNSLINSYGSPWGDDSTGTQFASGPNGYLAQKSTVEQAIDNIITGLDGLSDSVGTSANNFEAQDG